MAQKEQKVTSRYKFVATIDGTKFYPKGFYYQGKFVILVGCTKTDHTIRRKEKIDDVEIEVIKEDETVSIHSTL
jgi:hypothetical protein